MTRHQAEYAKRRAAGLCSRCGRVPPVEDRVNCATCQVKQQRSQVVSNRRRMQKRRALLVATTGTVTYVLPRWSPVAGSLALQMIAVENSRRRSSGA